MKITDPEVIRNGEKDLIDSVRDDLDLEMVKQILEKKLSATTLAAQGGEIIVHDNKIAFRLNFELNLSGSLMFDREGNYIPGQSDISSLPEDEPSPSMAEPAEQDAPTFTADEKEEGGPEEPLEEEFSIGLPDFDLEDEEPVPGDHNQEAEPLFTDEDSPEDTIPPDITADIDLESGREEQLIDDDINDILKESQEFWEKKKGS